MSSIIPIFFTFDSNYVTAAAVTFHSLLENADPSLQYRLYVLHAGIPERLRKRLYRVVAHFSNAELGFINVARFDNELITTAKSHFSKEIYYKLLAPQIFPQYDRILCSDVDVVFTGDIAPSFFAFDNDDFYYAGVGQITHDDRRIAKYNDNFTADEIDTLRHEIAAGYLLLNLKAMRADGTDMRVPKYYCDNYHRLLLPEQDCLILCCWPKVRHLDLKYVVSNSFYRLDAASVEFDHYNPQLPPDNAERITMFTNALAHPVQVHYVGPNKPWNSIGVPRQGLWFRYLWRSRQLLPYLAEIPHHICLRLKRYSLRRFINKQINRIKR